MVGGVITFLNYQADFLSKFNTAFETWQFAPLF
jgi:hypothetical protein